MSEKQSKILIIGAGVAGQMVVKELVRSSTPARCIAGYLDDDVNKIGKKIHGFKVLSGVDSINKVIRKEKIDEVIIAVPSQSQLVAKKVDRLLKTDVKVRILPALAPVILGKVNLSFLKEVEPSDLLGRPLVKSDQKKIVDSTNGLVFLITGAAGSIGSEIVYQLSLTQAKKIICLDSWEEGCFRLVEKYKNLKFPKVEVYVGNVRDKERIDEIFKAVKPDVVFHAAAYKHVPLMEVNKEEAVKTNIAGTKNCLDAATKYNTSGFVLISTDKAVNPSSHMGYTKRQAELMVMDVAKKNKKSLFISVRFGNVLNSSGSVVPTFVSQVKAGGPVTVTDKKMTRFFMTIPEAVSLVLQSWILGENGRIYVLDMGEPVKILSLARAIIRHFGLTPGKDIKIKETGIRPGEKLHEQLSYKKEKLTQTVNPKIFIAE